MAALKALINSSSPPHGKPSDLQSLLKQLHAAYDLMVGIAKSGNPNHADEDKQFDEVRKAVNRIITLLQYAPSRTDKTPIESGDSGESSQSAESAEDSKAGSIGTLKQTLQAA